MVIHRKEDSDRVSVNEESLYSQLQEHHPCNVEINHDFCEDEPRDIVSEESSTGSTFQQECSLRLMMEETSESNSDSVEERGIPDLTLEVDPKTVDNINSSNYKKGHYSTNVCDAIRLASTTQVRLERLRNTELISEETCQSREYHTLSPAQDNDNDFCSVNEQANCISKRSKSHKQFSLTDERENCKKIPNEEFSCKFEDHSQTDKQTSLQHDGLRGNYIIASYATDRASRSNDEYYKMNSAKVTLTQKFTMDKEMGNENRESPIRKTTNDSDSLKLRRTDSGRNLGLKVNTENILKRHGTVSTQKENLVMRSDTYVENFETDGEMKSESTLRTMEIDSRIKITEESILDISTTHTANYNDLTDHRNLESSHNHVLKRSTSRRKDVLDVSSRSRKSQKKLSSGKRSSKSKFGILTENTHDITNDSIDTQNHNKIGKTKNRLTRSQRRDTQRSATAEIGEADDGDSGIQGDIYEFNEKESNLEDIGILSIIRRGKHESRHAPTISSHLQEMQCDDKYSKAEPPVLIPQEPWPLTDASQNEISRNSNSDVQSGENCDAEEGLQR